MKINIRIDTPKEREKYKILAPPTTSQNDLYFSFYDGVLMSAFCCLNNIIEGINGL